MNTLITTNLIFLLTALLLLPAAGCEQTSQPPSETHTEETAMQQSSEESSAEEAEETEQTKETEPAESTQNVDFEQPMRELGDVASAVVDGDDCLTIVTERAAELMFKVDPRDKWAGADNYDVNHEPFIRNRKLLIRIASLVDFPVDCNLWMISKARPDMVHMVIRQEHSWSLFYNFGDIAIEPPADFLPVLEEGKQVVARMDGNPRISVLSPVRNALGDVVGLVEICTNPEAH